MSERDGRRGGTVFAANGDVSQIIKGVKYLHFNCGKCGSCCYLWAPVTDEDVRRIMECTSLPPEKVVQFVDSSRIESSHSVIAWVKLGLGETAKKAMCLRESRGHCLFLKAKRCSIYANRPGVCRGHPFMLTMNDTGRKISSIEINRATGCAHTFNGEISRRDLKRLHYFNLVQDERYLNKVKRWNRSKHPGTEEEFLHFLGL